MTRPTGRIVRKSNRTRSVAEFIARQVEICQKRGKPQSQIAREVGFERAATISMIKIGKMKLPMERIGVFAKSLGIDPTYLFSLCMNEYYPEIWKVIQGDILKQPVLTRNELEFLKVIRSANVADPKLRTSGERRSLREFVKTLCGEGDEVGGEAAPE
jgi:transcriptional regulator with XRE-family HTH domain